MRTNEMRGCVKRQQEDQKFKPVFDKVISAKHSLIGKAFTGQR